MIKYLIIFAVIVILKALYNLYNYLMCKYCEKKFLLSYVKDTHINISEYVPLIRNLFKTAGIDERFVSESVPLGYGYFSTQKLAILDNICTQRAEIAWMVNELFSQAKGTFKMRLLNCFNPFYWIECLIYLPRNIFSYLGLDSSKLFVKVIQVIWWFVTPAFILWRTKIYELFFSFFSNR